MKRRVNELEADFNPKPLFIESLFMIVPKYYARGVSGSSSRFGRKTKLLSGIKRFVDKNINKRLYIILESWYITASASVVSGRINHLGNYLRKDLENEKNAIRCVMCLT